MGRGRNKMSKPSNGRSGEAPETCRSGGTNENNPKNNGDLGSGIQRKIPNCFSPTKPQPVRPPLQEENSALHNEGKNMGRASSGTPKKAEAEKTIISRREQSSRERPSKVTDQKAGEGGALDIAPKQKQTLTEPPKKPSSADRKQERRMVKSKRKVQPTKSPNRKVTDYFPIRRSCRKSKKDLELEEKKRIDDLILSGKEEGMKIDNILGKGRGVIATQDFSRGEFVVEYHGDLIEITDAKKREEAYSQDSSTGCYMYYFQYQNKSYCVDATKETNRLGRLINHSKTGNCHTKLYDINGTPHLILIASRDIEAGEELLYDYGDRSKSSIEAHPWLKN